MLFKKKADLGTVIPIPEADEDGQIILLGNESSKFIYIPTGYHTFYIADAYFQGGKPYRLPMPAMILDTASHRVFLAPGVLREKSPLYVPYLYNFNASSKACSLRASGSASGLYGSRTDYMQLLFQTTFNGGLYTGLEHFPPQFRRLVRLAAWKSKFQKKRPGIRRKLLADYGRLAAKSVRTINHWSWHKTRMVDTFDAIVYTSMLRFEAVEYFKCLHTATAP